MVNKKQKAKEIHKKHPTKVMPIEYITQRRLEESIIDHKDNFVKDKKEIGFR